jgi:DNA replication protein DnaC
MSTDYLIKLNVERHLASIPEAFRHVTMKTVYGLHGEDKLDKIKPWLAYPKQNILLFGAPGTGKTCLCYALILDLLSRGFITLGDFLLTSSVRIDSELLQAIKSDEGDYLTLKKLKEIPFMVMDDLGRENTTERTNRQYFDLIDFRQSARKPTIMTTNLDPKELAKRYDPAIVSRMQEWIFIAFQGKDLRRGDYKT